MKAKNIRTRFAPSPTGFIHIGSVYSIMFDYAFAKKHKGQFILRIEDTDKKRYVPGSEEKIYQTLDWFGFSPDENYRQSERLDIYKKYAEELVKKNYAYYCFCSPERLRKLREEQKKRKQLPRYDRHCRFLGKKEVEKRLAKGEKYVIRMKIPDNETIIVNDLIRGEIAFDSNLIDDQVLLKSDGFPTYHLAVVVDDHLMKISHIIRGEEWLSSSPKHVLLYRYFGWQMPVLLHTPILRNPDKSKMSKRRKHTSLDWYREQGFLPEALLNFLALLGWSHPQEKEIFSFNEFIKFFDLKDVNPIGPVFDLTKLEWMNGVYIRNKTDNELAELLGPFLPKMSERQILAAAPLIKKRIKKLSEAKELLEFVWRRLDYPFNLLLQRNLRKRRAREMLEKAKEVIQKTRIGKTELLRQRLMDLIKRNSWGVGDFFMVLRVAICGKKITPPIVESLPLLKKEEILARLDIAIKKLLPG